MERYKYLILFGFVLVEIYVYQAFKQVFVQGVARKLYWIFTVLVYAGLIFLTLTFNKGDRDTHKVNWLISIMMLFIIPKIFVALFLGIEDISRFFGFVVKKISGSGENHYPERRKFFSYAGWGLVAVSMALIADGIVFGKYRFQAIRRKIKIKNLPIAFKGYKIIQISDVHSGSFHEPEKIRHAIDMINLEQPDLILFTGDLVNAYADEFIPLLPYFKN